MVRDVHASLTHLTVKNLKLCLRFFNLLLQLLHFFLRLGLEKVVFTLSEELLLRDIEEFLVSE